VYQQQTNKTSNNGASSASPTNGDNTTTNTVSPTSSNNNNNNTSPTSATNTPLKNNPDSPTAVTIPILSPLKQPSTTGTTIDGITNSFQNMSTSTASTGSLNSNWAERGVPEYIPKQQLQLK